MILSPVPRLCLIAPALAILMACTSDPKTADTLQAHAAEAAIDSFLVRHLARPMHVDRVDSALSEDSILFSSALLKELLADRQAQAADPSVITGLDFDPFTASQDPCETYAVGTAEARADTLVIPVQSTCTGSHSSLPDALYLVVNQGVRHVIADIEYPGAHARLRTLLASYRNAEPEP